MDLTNTNELKAFYSKQGFTLERLAEHIGLSRTTMSYKINNKIEFKSSEILAIQKVLKMTNEEREAIFFGIKVD